MITWIGVKLLYSWIVPQSYTICGGVYANELSTSRSRWWSGTHWTGTVQTHWKTGTWHTCTIFSPNQLQHKLRPADDSKDFIGCVNHNVNFLHYSTKLLTHKNTHHLTLTLTSEFGCTAGVALDWRCKESCSSGDKHFIRLCVMRSPGRSVTPQPDLTGQWCIFSYTQSYYPLLPCKFQVPGHPRCLKQSNRVKSSPALG